MKPFRYVERGARACDDRARRTSLLFEPLTGFPHGAEENLSSAWRETARVPRFHLVEVVAELVFLLISVAAGFAVGAVVYLFVRGARWTLLRAERSASVVDPHGRHWTVQVPLAPSVRFWASLRLFGMRPGDRRGRALAGLAEDGVGPSELANPKGLVSRTDEAAGLVALLLLLLVLVGTALLLLEVVVALLAALAMSLVGLIRGGWRCEVIDPNGRRTSESTVSLREARARCREMRLAIEHHGTPTGHLR